MDDGQEQDHYEERLKEVFNGFDSTGRGSLSPEELSDLCLSLHLDDATPVLLQTLLQNQDRLTARVDFDQFKNALILVLSASIEPPPAEEESLPKPDSPVIQPKFVKGSKRYGRRSTPEFVEPASDLSEIGEVNPANGEDLEDNYDSAVPRKRERWNVNESSTEEYEAEGQMHLWNPDEPSTPRGSVPPLSIRLEERLRDACEDLDISMDGCAGHTDLLALCDHLGLEPSRDALLRLSEDGAMDVQEFVSMVARHNKPPTPTASTPYRQLKRHHSTQPFDEGGRRISVFTSTIGMRLFSIFDDGTGYIPAEQILDAWIDEGVENGAEILLALNFDLDGKLSLADLTTALENELLVTKNGIHQAALASFKAEIRYLLERVDQEIREKEKIRSDLEKAEKQKTQLAAEVDEHHSAIEHANNLNLRKLEQEHREKLSAARSELVKEMDRIQQQADLQREQLETEMEKIREDECFLRDHLSISVKENRRLEMELLDSNEKLAESQSQITKLQSSLDNILKNKFGDFDPGSADFLIQEERIKQLRNGYEEQCRELQDRIDELQSELQDFHALGRTLEPCHKTLSEELESKSPGMESDPGIGSEDVQPFSMSLEAEMMMEQLKEKHLQEMEDLRSELESKMNEFDVMVEEERLTHERQKTALTLRYQQEVQVLKEEAADVRNREEELLSRLRRAELEQQADGSDGVQERRDEEAANLREQLEEARLRAEELENQLKNLEIQLEETDKNHLTKMEELRNRHAAETNKLTEEKEQLEAGLAEEREEREKQSAAREEKFLKDWEREKDAMLEKHKEEVKTKLEESKRRFEEEREEAVKSLTEKWQKEKAQLDQQSNESLQMLLEEEMLKLFREQEEKEKSLREEWESERTLLQERLENVTEEKLRAQEASERREARLTEEWKSARLQLEEDYEGTIRDRLSEQREKFEREKEEQEQRLERLMAKETERLEESHRDAMKELSARHADERDALGATMDRLREDIAQEREEVQINFNRRIREVEERFSGDQESVAERFQANVSKLERHYQNELAALSESHELQKLQWEAEMQNLLRSSREHLKEREETLKTEMIGEWEENREKLDEVYGEKIELLIVENKQLKDELEELTSEAQNKEIDLSMQLNELHGRLQEQRELLHQAESEALRAELLLNRTVEDFTQERAELLGSNSELEAKFREALGVSEEQVAERIRLLDERNDLKVKVEELETLLKQAVEDFRVEREELQENLFTLERQLKVNGEKNEAEMETNQLLTTEENKMKESSYFVEIPDVKTSQRLAGNISADQDCSGGPETRNDQSEEDADEIPPENFTDDEVDLIPDHALEHQTREQSDRLVGKPSDRCSCAGNESKSVSQEVQCEIISSLGGFGGAEDKVVVQSCENENKPQDVPAAAYGSRSHEDKHHHETVVAVSMLEETVERGAQEDEVKCSPGSGRSNEGSEVLSDSDCEHSVEETSDETQDEYSHDRAETLHESLWRFRALYNTATEENLLLHEKIALLRQKTEILEDLLAHHSEKIKTGQQALEENYNLKVQMLVFMEHVKELEKKALETTHLQIRYEDCVCENVKLKEQNAELERRVWSVEGRINVFHDVQGRHSSLLDEISRMRSENCKLFVLLNELERQDDAKQPMSLGEVLLLEEEVQEGTQLEDCCKEFEMQNGKLRRAITELQDKSETLDETAQAHRSEASRLAEENAVLRQKIAALKEGDLKEVQDELIQTLDYLKTEKFAAQKAADNFKNEISELRLQSELLESENGLLTEKNAHNFAEMENLQQQLAELIKEKADEKTKMAACVLALEVELTKALEDSAQLEERNIQLSQQLSELVEKAIRVDVMENQLSHLVEEHKNVNKETLGLRTQLAKSQEKVKTVDESLLAVNQQSSRLKSDLRVVQQEKDSLQHEVTVLHKQLQNANNKNHILEMALHSSGLQNQSKKLYREEMSRLMEQDQLLLRQENERLQTEVCSIKSELIQSREKILQLDATIQLLNKRKKTGQSSLVKALELENASLKQELEAKREVSKGSDAERSHTDMESLQQENEALKAQMARLSSQLLETFQAQFVGLMPPSPHRVPRGHRGEEPDNMQDEREKKMKNMEERMKEIELSLHNVKLLLKEKVAQLKDQLHKNGKADVLINDLYVENAQLLKTLEITEQRHKIAEKKNYLLEEKISSLNKIVRDLNLSPALPYNYKCS